MKNARALGEDDHQKAQENKETGEDVEEDESEGPYFLGSPNVDPDEVARLLGPTDGDCEFIVKVVLNLASLSGVDAPVAAISFRLYLIHELFRSGNVFKGDKVAIEIGCFFVLFDLLDKAFHTSCISIRSVQSLKSGSQIFPDLILVFVLEELPK